MLWLVAAPYAINAYWFIFYKVYPLAGLHRPVVLYTVAQTHIEDIMVVTDIVGADGLVKAAARLNISATAQGSAQLWSGQHPFSTT